MRGKFCALAISFARVYSQDRPHPDVLVELL